MKKSTEQFAAELKSKWGLTLTSDYLGAHKIVTFLCSEGHRNEGAATNVLQRGYVCKECKTGREIISKLEWTDNLVLELQELFTEGFTTEQLAVHFKTTKSAIHNATNKFGILRTKAMEILPKLLEVLKIQDRTLVSEFTCATGFITVKCSKGHIITQGANNVLHKNTGCPDCFKTEPSRAEKELRQFISDNYTGWIVYNDRKILGGKELDIVLPDIGLAFEFNGTFWHSDAKVDKYYHQNKTNSVEDFGYQLIHISDYLWNTKQELLKTKIRNMLIPTTRIGARKCKIKEVPWKEAKLFLEDTHIQGAGAATKYNYGLYYNDALVAIATFRSPRFSKEEDFELVRYSSSIPVQGGLSKLLKHSVVGKSIITYALRDFSTGNLYKQLGFTLKSYSEPGYAYYKKGVSKISRYQAQKHLLEALLPIFDDKLSEEENMRANGWYKVYDSGNLVFTR